MTKRVITYGTFDLFHIGHVRLLRRLAGLGDHLTVCVSSDEFNAVKGKQSVIPYVQRAEILQACRYVDHVLPEHHWDQKRDDIVREKIDIFAMGDDWSGKFDDLGDLCQVVYLPRTSDISTTSLKAYMDALRTDQITEIKHLIDTLNTRPSSLPRSDPRRRPGRSRRLITSVTTMRWRRSATAIVCPGWRRGSSCNARHAARPMPRSA